MKSRLNDTKNGSAQAANGLRLLTLSGVAFAFLCVCFYALMLSKSLWESPTLVPDKWKTIFRPIRDLFPREWVMSRKGSEQALLNNLLYLVLIVAFFALYFFVIVRLWNGRLLFAKSGGGALRRVMLFTVPMLAVLFVVHGSLSSDLQSYAWYGRILAIFGDNPLVNVPAEYAWSDRAKWIQWVYWKDTPSVYGPVWLWIAGGVAKVAQAIDGDIVTNLLGHKLVASLAHLVNIALLWRVVGLALRKYGMAFGKRASAATGLDALTTLQVAATVTYAWNPLALLEFGANGHNDVLMLTFMLAALWLHLKGKWPLAIAALAGAALIKLIAIVLVPGYLWLLFWQGRTEIPAEEQEPWHKGIMRVAQAALIFSGLIVLAYIPFWAGPEILKSLSGGPPSTRMVNSLSDIFKYHGADLLSAIAHAQHWHPYLFWEPGAIADRLDWPLRWGPLMISGAWAVLRTWGARTFPEMVKAWGWVLLIYLTVGSVWYWPWYASWLLVPVALLGPGRLMWASLILSGSSMLLYAMFPIMAAPYEELPKWSGLVIMAPPMAYLLAGWARDRLRQRRQLPVPRNSPLGGHSSSLVPAAVPVPLRPEPLLTALSDSAHTQEHYQPTDFAHQDHELF
ncbi:MAG: alpha,6-mannosyltransferase [Chloroflexia bacterium]|jgi:hypothetical protein|nr:alpha,6-mannosyltransferase [Chloroflexia bacterium]